MSTSYPPYYAFPSAPPLRRALPKPPRLHWGWVLGLSIITRGVFSSVWLFVQANWVRRVLGKSVAFWLALVNLLWLPLAFVSGVCAVLLAHFAHSDPSAIVAPLTGLIFGGTVLMYLATVFVLRREMQSPAIGMTLGAFVSFWLGPTYFQYHLRDYDAPYAPEGTGLGLSQADRVFETGQPVAYPSAESVGVVYGDTKRSPKAPMVEPQPRL